MATLVRIVRLTSRNAPDGSWSVGDAGSVTPSDARRLIALGHAKLADGEVLPPYEVASLDIGSVAGGEIAGRVAGRDRGSS